MHGLRGNIATRSVQSRQDSLAQRSRLTDRHQRAVPLALQDFSRPALAIGRHDRRADRQCLDQRRRQGFGYRRKHEDRRPASM